MKIHHTVMKWKCGECDTVNFSHSTSHHKLDMCTSCKQSGIDLEYYMCRMIGNVNVVDSYCCTCKHKWKPDEEPCVHHKESEGCKCCGTSLTEAEEEGKLCGDCL